MAKDKYSPAGQIDMAGIGNWALGMVVDVIVQTGKKVKTVKQCVYRLH